MKECWPEGNLRAYHDGELLPADMERVAAHLAECPGCEALADEVAGRAARVANLLAALPEPEQVIWMPRGTGIPARVSEGKQWVAAALALAAGIAIAIALAPKDRESPVPAAAVLPAAPAPSVASVVAPTVQPAQTAAARRTPRRAPPRQVFFALDDEPIETGVVVRVALGDAEIPADVIYGADGRAHAIRLVGNQFHK